MKELDFNPIKSKREFLENYELSDRVAQMGDEMLRKNGYTPIPSARIDETNGYGKWVRTNLIVRS